MIFQKDEDFVVNINEAGDITVKLADRDNAAVHILFDENGDINKKIPIEIKKILGKQIDIYGLRDKLDIVREKKNKYKKIIKKNEELVKTKDDELKKQDDVIKEKEKEMTRLKELEELIKSKDEIIKANYDEAAIKEKEITRLNELKELIKSRDEIIKSKDEIIKSKDDEAAIKVKDVTRLNELEELIKSKDEIIKSKDYEVARKVKDVTVIKQMTDRDMEEARKEIEKITIEFHIEREKRINAEKKLEIDKKSLVELQNKIASLEIERVKLEHDNKEIRESGDGFNQNLVRKNEELLKKLNESEKLANDMADMTQEKIMKSVEDINEARRSEAEAAARMKLMGNRIIELEKLNDDEVAGSRRNINRLESELNNAKRNLEVLRNESMDSFANYDRFVQELEKKISDLEEEKKANDLRFRALSEQLEQDKSVNNERIRVLTEQLERTDIGEIVRSNIEQEREVLEERNNELDEQVEREREEVEERNSEIDVELDGDPERMTLKERIKSIFKKYGFTITAILLSISAIVVTIVTNSLSAVAKMAKGVANGLKDIGKKLAQILPGMVGAIASFIFRTAGEVIGFLAKNAWLLVVAVVVYFVENLKKKKRK